MSDQPTREPIPSRRRGRVLPALLVLIAAGALVVLLSPGVARTDECLTDPSAENQPACGGGPLPSPTPPPGGGGGGGGSSCSGAVVLYQHANHEGQCWGFSAGQTAYVGDAANDQASSIWVADGYVATLFPNSSFAGDYDNTATAPDPWRWTSVGNDSVSSLVVQLAEPDGSYYSGDNQTSKPPPAGVSSSVGAASGCARVGGGVERRGASGRQWVFALFTRFCWNGSAVTAVWAGEVAAVIAPIPFPLGLIQGWRYTPVAFQAGEPGYPSTVLRADGRFEYCGFKYGCITSYQPWVRIELFRNGKALCSTSAHTQLYTCERF